MTQKETQKSSVIIFEGIDGVGKSTQIKLAQDYLASKRIQAIVLRNLGSTPIGEKIREVMLSQVDRPPTTDLYMSVAVQEALIDEINKYRSANTVILMDRSPLSLAAYQSYGSGLKKDQVWSYVVDGMKRIDPELTILLTGNVQKAIARARTSSDADDYFESKPDEYFERVARGFEDMTSEFEINKIDVDEGIDETWQAVKKLISDLLS